MVVVRDVDVALTDQEAAVYDRQIRVWGVETQRALRAARVLVGSVGWSAAARGASIRARSTVIFDGEWRARAGSLSLSWMCVLVSFDRAPVPVHL